MVRSPRCFGNAKRKDEQRQSEALNNTKVEDDRTEDIATDEGRPGLQSPLGKRLRRSSGRHYYFLPHSLIRNNHYQFRVTCLVPIVDLIEQSICLVPTMRP